ncbi:MAG: peptidylprolyl isomerase [Spirochaetales bacterium]|nr:peptidylprolyl isomerase [Spirochaetales bacterium]
MRLRIPIAVAFMFVGLSVAFAGGNRESEESAPADVADEAAVEHVSAADAVARVNGVLVGREEFDAVVESNIYRYEYQSGQTFDEAQRGLLERQVLDGLITRTVLEQEGEALEIVISDERLAETLDQFKAQFPNESAYQVALEEQGFTEAEFEVELRRQLMIEELIRVEVYETIEVDEGEVRAFYDGNPQFFERPEQVAARHIIFTAQEGQDETERAARREELASIRRRIVEGADFSEMAQEHSEGPSAAAGGDLGVFGRGQMVGPFEEAAFALEVGEVSEIVETQFGYHIIQVTERIPAQTQPFEAVAAEIEQFLGDEARNRGAQEYVRDLREAAEVDELIEIAEGTGGSGE